MRIMNVVQKKKAGRSHFDLIFKVFEENSECQIECQLTTFKIRVISDQNLMFANEFRDGGPNFRLANHINR